MTQRVLISIDTEAPVGLDGINNLIFCKTKKGEYGINYLMDCFDRYKFKALFFVDLAEAWEYGESEICAVLRAIDKRGHDIGVHIHPDRMADPKRRFLWQYSYEEQLSIIQKCTDLYEKTLLRKPKSFRAGRYGADENTIRALSKLGYEIDMSYFYSRKTCQLDSSLSYNQVFAIDNVIEVPVTSFKSFKFFKYQRHDKLDFSMPFLEFKHVFKHMLKEQCVDVASFFLHSFSLVNWRKKPDSPRLLTRNVKKLDKMLKFLSDRRFQVISEADVFEPAAYGPKPGFDLSKSILAPLFFAIRALSTLKDRLERNV